MWKFYRAQEVFEKYQEQWDHLNEAINNHVLLDSNFWGALVRLFSNEKTLLGISESLEYPGMILVENNGFGMWSTFQPPQAPIGPILLGNPNNIEAQLCAILRSLPGYALGLGITQQDPNFGYVNSVGLNKTVEVKKYVQTARIGIQGSFEQYWSARGNDLKVNLRKRLRRLEREGIHVALHIHQSSWDVAESIQQYGELEASGWKGRGGTAVTADNIQGAFYRSMLEKACQRHEGLIYSLRFNDKIVAQKICLRRNKMVVFLKMAYDEQYRRLSPGYILQYKILQRLFEDQNVQDVETYGRVNEGWTNKWTSDFRTMYHLNYFRHVGMRRAKQFFSGIRAGSDGGFLDSNESVPQTAASTRDEIASPSNGHASLVTSSDARNDVRNGLLTRGKEWEVLNARDGFANYQGQWDELNKRIDNHLLLDSKFVAPLIKYFSSSRTLLAISKNPEYPGMVLVENIGKGFWQTFQPSQAPIGLILLANKNDLEKQVQALMGSLPGYSLGLSITQQDPDYSVFAPYSKWNNLEFVEYITTPRISIVNTFEDYWKSRGKDLAGNLVRRKKRLNEQGVQISISIIRDWEQVSEAVKVYGQLEETGWKGAEGTAVAVDNEQSWFYSEMLMNFCSQGEGLIYQLLMDGKPIASDLCLRRHGMLILLKTAYDEEYKKLSPSYLMREEILKRLFFRKTIKVLEFYGRARDWHAKWTDEMRTMYHINFYRHAWIEKGRNALKTGGLWSGESRH